LEERQRPGLLIYFPVIPGSGKSSICSSITASTFDPKNSGENYEEGDKLNRRETIVRQGDSVKAKYYTVVQQEKQEDPSSIYICDKNVPPISWRSVRDIGRDSRSTMLPALPDRSAFCTTHVTLSPSTVEKVEDQLEQERGTNTATTTVYPYSLHYLAVCMLRVLRREPKTHTGKLDSGLPTACLIVTKFYCLYKNYTSERLLEHVVEKTYQEEEEEEEDKHSTKSEKDQRYMSIPFFNRHPLPALPPPLSQILHEALSVHYATDTTASNIDKKALANHCRNFERRLRSILMEHSSFLDDLVVGVDESRMAFQTQVGEQVGRLKDTFDDGFREESVDAAGGVGVRIAAIDVECKAVWNILRGIVAKKNKKKESIIDGTNTITELPQFLLDLSPNNDDTDTNDTEDDVRLSLPSGKVDKQYIKKTHVTMAHHSQLTQSELHSRFDSLIGSKVKIRAKSLFYNDHVAALEIEIDDKNNEKGTSTAALPLPMNDFVHITVWCKDGVKSKEANELVERSGKKKGGDGGSGSIGDGGTKIVLEEPIMLEGVVAFWYGEKDIPF